MREKYWMSCQNTMIKNLNMSCSADTVRNVMHLIRFSYRKSRPAHEKSASEEQSFKANAGALLARLAVLGYLIMSLDEASCMVGGWNGYGWLPVGGRETCNAKPFWTRCRAKEPC